MDKRSPANGGNTNCASAITEGVFKSLILPGLVLFKTEYGKNRGREKQDIAYNKEIDQFINKYTNELKINEESFKESVEILDKQRRELQTRRIQKEEEKKNEETFT